MDNTYALYSSMPGWERATRSLDQIITREAARAVKGEKSVQQAFVTVMHLAESLRRFGAADTDSRDCIAAELEKQAGVEPYTIRRTE